MRTIALSLFLASLLLFGCLKIESKAPVNSQTPTPQIIYVNVTSSPQVIVTVQTTVIPTVTEKIVVPSATSIPLPKPKGNLTDLGVRTEYVKLDIQKAANADYHHSPFIYHDSTGVSLYPALTEGEIFWKGIPFYILPVYETSGKWSVITTAYEDFYSVNFVAGRNRLSEIYFLAMGSFREGENRPLANININYEDGAVQSKPIASNADVWNYEQDANYPVPKEAIAFESSQGGKEQMLTAIRMDVEQPLVPIGGVTIKKVGSGISGFSIFSATGIKRFREKKLTQTQTEFQLPTYSRELATTLPEGAMINYDDSSGSKVYRPKGTILSPVFDGETDLVNWRKAEWNALVPTGGSVKVFVRVGSEPKGPFSDWEEAVNGGDIGKDARLLQFKAEFTTSDSKLTPILRGISFTYENPE